MPRRDRDRETGAVRDLGSWRAALRIASRECRRARGRAALVVAMIALPVLALSFAAVTYDMFHLSPAEQLDRRLGAADARLRWVTDGPLRQDPSGDGWTADGNRRSRPATTAEVTALLPPGSRAIPTAEPDWLDVRIPGGVGSIQIRTLDVADPMARGQVRLRSGRAPGGAGEAVATEPALRRLGAGLGGTVALADGTRGYTVVGLVEFPDDLGEVLAVPPGSLPHPAEAWLVQVPGGVDWTLVGQLNRRGVVATSRAVILDPPPPGESPFPVQQHDPYRMLSGGVLIGGLGTLEVVLLAGPAFAVGARRRRRDLALVAAGGGTAADLRRIVLADGVVLGVVGAVAGVTLGVAAAVAGRPLVERHLAHATAGGYRFFPLALLGIGVLAVVTGTLAALVPAYVAARQDVVAGLTGRRGVVRSRKRWLVAGLTLTGAGTALAAFGATRVATDVILAGLVLGEIGLVLCTPSLVGLLARLGRLLPLAPRLALRDTARNRAAAAPAISAVMAAVAGSVAIGVYLVSDEARSDAAYRPALPPGYLAVISGRPAPVDPVPAQRLLTAAADLPVTGLAEVREPTCPAGTAPEIYCSLAATLPPERECPYRYRDGMSARERLQARADERCGERMRAYYGTTFSDVLDDGQLLPMLTAARPDDVAAATATLRAGGVVVTDPRYVRDGQVTVRVLRSSPDTATPEPVTTVTVSVPGYALTTGLELPGAIFSPGLLARTGLAARQVGFVLATSAAPDTVQQERFAATVREVRSDLRVEVERGRPASRTDVTLIVLAIAAGLITLGAAGIATGLAAADGRAELSTLAAIGASPRVRRALSLSQSGVIAGLGSLLGIAAGLAAAFAILAALNRAYAGMWPIEEPYPLRIPWHTLGVLVVVPLVAMLGAGLLTRSRLPIERRRE